MRLKHPADAMVEPHAAEHGSDTCQLGLVLQLFRAAVVYRHVSASSLQTSDKRGPSQPLTAAPSGLPQAHRCRSISMQQHDWGRCCSSPPLRRLSLPRFSFQQEASLAHAIMPPARALTILACSWRLWTLVSTASHVRSLDHTADDRQSVLIQDSWGHHGHVSRSRRN